MNKRCFETAAHLCPNGYYFARAAGSVPAAAPRADVVDDSTGDDADSESPPPVVPSPHAGVNARTLPPQERWGDGMYSRKRGTILVRCADTRATASR